MLNIEAGGKINTGLPDCCFCWTFILLMSEGGESTVTAFSRSPFRDYEAAEGGAAKARF